MKIKNYIIYWSLFMAALLSAQNSDDLLLNVQKKFRSITNFTADFKQIIIPFDSKDGVLSAGKFGYGEGNKFYLNLTDTDILSDGKTIWNYNKKLKRALINNIADDPGAFSLEKYILEYPTLCSSELIEDKTSSKKSVILTPREGNLGFSKARLWVDDDYIVTKFEITDTGQNKIYIELKNIKINVSVSQEKFMFNPPEGIQIIDLR